MSEFFKLLEAVFKLERVLHCNREQAERFVAACYAGTAYDGECPGDKLDLFMKGGIFDLFACADDGGARIAGAIYGALEADGFRFNVDLDERDERDELSIDEIFGIFLNRRMWQPQHRQIPR